MTIIFQVQGQLYCSNLDLKRIIFVVYFGEDNPLNIFFDASCWDEYLPKIDYYFKRAFFSRNVDQEGSTWKTALHLQWMDSIWKLFLHIKWS